MHLRGTRAGTLGNAHRAVRTEIESTVSGGGISLTKWDKNERGDVLVTL